MIIGVTEIAASGKSTLISVAAAGLQCGGWNADAAIKGLFKFDRTFIEILSRKFPKTYNTNKNIIDQDTLFEIISSSHKKKHEFINIMHPYLKNILKNIIDKMNNKKILLEIPLLFEYGWEDLCDRVIVLVCSKKVQKERLTIRNANTYFYNLVNNKHWSNEQKSSQAHYVLNTSGHFDETARSFMLALETLF